MGQARQHEEPEISVHFARWGCIHLDDILSVLSKTFN